MGLIGSFILFITISLGSVTLSAQPKASSEPKAQNIVRDSVSKNPSNDIDKVLQLYQEVTTSQDRIFTYIITAVGLFLVALTAAVGFLTNIQIRKMAENEFQKKAEQVAGLIRPQFSHLATLYQTMTHSITNILPQDEQPVMIQKTLLRIALGLNIGDLFLQAFNILAAKNAFAQVVNDCRQIISRLSREEALQQRLIAEIQQIVDRLNISVLGLEGVREFETDRQNLTAVTADLRSRFL